MTDRKKVILVGGMAFNVPKELHEKFDIVKHYEQGDKTGGTMPEGDYIFVISNWASHSLVSSVKNRTGLPVVWLKKGWTQMRVELERRSILPPEAESVAPPVVESPSAASAPPEEAKREPKPTTGLSEDDLWRLYGKKMIDTLRTCMKIGAKNRTSDVLDLASLELGPPPEDLAMILPRLLMSGVVREDGEKLILMSAPGQEYDLGEDPDPKVYDKETSLKRRVDLIRGLPAGPYATKEIFSREMSRYEEFLDRNGVPFGEFSCRHVINKALEKGFVEKVKDGYFVNHKPSIKLTAIKTSDVPRSPDPAVPVAQAGPPAPPEPPKPNVLSREEAEAKWPEIMERCKAARFDVGELLVGAVPIWNPERSVMSVTLARQFVSWQLDFLKNPKVRRMVDGAALDLLGLGSRVEFSLHPDASGFLIQDGEYEVVVGSVKVSGFRVTFRFSLLDPKYAGFGTEKTLNVSKDTDELCRVVEACGVKLETFVNALEEKGKTVNQVYKLFVGKRLKVRLERSVGDGDAFTIYFVKKAKGA